jgi:formate dehydrogenase subunit gamma
MTGNTSVLEPLKPIANPSVSAKLDAASEAIVNAALLDHLDMPGALLPILHQVQDDLGFIPSAAVPLIANGLNLSRAEVHGVVTYYHHFRDHAPGRCIVQVCRAESCKAMGADALMAHAQTQLGCEQHGTSKDGLFSLEPAFCLGLCASSPAIMIGDEPHARVTQALFNELVADTKATLKVTA